MVLPSSSDAARNLKMANRRSSLNGLVSQTARGRRRRNAVADIFAELTESDRRVLQEQAQNLLHPAVTGSPPSPPEEMTPEVMPKRRRRNAVANLMDGVRQEDIQQLRDQALALQHPALLMTTPPGAPGGLPEATAFGVAGTSPIAIPTSTPFLSRSLSSSGPSQIAITGDDTFDPYSISPSSPSEFQHGLLHPSYGAEATLSTSLSATLSTRGRHHSPCPCSPDGSPNSLVLTETDGDVFRERIARSSNRYRERRNAVCYEDATQVFLNNIIAAVMKCRKQRRENNNNCNNINNNTLMPSESD